MAEHQLPKLNTGGSIPLTCSKNGKYHLMLVVFYFFTFYSRLAFFRLPVVRSRTRVRLPLKRAYQSASPCK